MLPGCRARKRTRARKLVPSVVSSGRSVFAAVPGRQSIRAVLTRRFVVCVVFRVTCVVSLLSRCSPATSRLSISATACCLCRFSLLFSLLFYLPLPVIPPPFVRHDRRPETIAVGVFEYFEDNAFVLLSPSEIRRCESHYESVAVEGLNNACAPSERKTCISPEFRFAPLPSPVPATLPSSPLACHFLVTTSPLQSRFDHHQFGAATVRNTSVYQYQSPSIDNPVRSEQPAGRFNQRFVTVSC